MPIKLTLTLNDKVIAQAKNYAKQQNKSLSLLVEEYLLTLILKNKKENKISPRILKLKGVINLSSDFDYKKELIERLVKKHKI